MHGVDDDVYMFVGFFWNVANGYYPLLRMALCCKFEVYHVSYTRE